MIAYKLITPQITEEEYEEALRTIKESSKEKGYILEIRTAGNVADEIERKIYTDLASAKEAYAEAVHNKIQEIGYDNEFTTKDYLDYKEELVEYPMDAINGIADPDGEWQVALFEAEVEK